MDAEEHAGVGEEEAEEEELYEAEEEDGESVDDLEVAARAAEGWVGWSADAVPSAATQAAGASLRLQPSTPSPPLTT